MDTQIEHDRHSLMELWSWWTVELAMTAVLVRFCFVSAWEIIPMRVQQPRQHASKKYFLLEVSHRARLRFHLSVTLSFVSWRPQPLSL